MGSNRIDVTGLGIISAVGTGREATLEALLTGRSGIGPIRHLETTHRDIPCAEVKESDEELKAMLGVAEETIITRTTLLGLIAAQEAIAHAGISNLRGKRIGFIHATTVGGMEKSEKYYPDFLSGDSRNAYIATHECGAGSDAIADYFNIFSYVTTLSTACSSAANAIILGANLLKAGILDIVVAGGSECLSRFHLNGFRTLMILDQQPCRPFDHTRAGLNLGEGAAYLVLERAGESADRGIEPLCRLSGYGNACDAFHQTASSEEGYGATLSISQALAMGGLRTEEIDYINAHGTGTPNNDLAEGHAIETVFGAKIPHVSSTKGMTGHTTSAAGSVEAVISILALQGRFVPANLFFREAMPELHFTPVDRLLEYVPLKHVLSNSFGFGGNNSSLIFSAIEKTKK